MNSYGKWAIGAALLSASALSMAESDLLAHIACQEEIAALGEVRGLDLEAGQTYVDPTGKNGYRYYLNATDAADGDRAYRATCLVTPRGKVLDAALENGRWAYTKRRLGNGRDSREGLASDNRH